MYCGHCVKFHPREIPFPGKLTLLSGFLYSATRASSFGSGDRVTAVHTQPTFQGFAMLRQAAKLKTSSASKSSGSKSSGKNVKRVYFFGNGKAEGGADMKDLL